MSKTLVLTPHEDLLDVVMEHLHLETNDLSDQVVVFPGQRPAHFLRKKLGEHFKASYKPPQIFSIELFVHELVKQSDGISNSLLSPLDAAALLYKVHVASRYALGESAFRSFAQFLPVGLKLYSEFEEVVLAEVSAQTFRSMMEATPYGRMQTMGLYFEAFYNEVRREGRTTRALTYCRAADIAETSIPRKYSVIVLAGFHTLTNVEKRLFQALRQQEQTVVLYQRNDAATSSEAGTTEAFLSPLPPVTITKAPDIHGQMFALAELLRSEKSQLDETSVVVLPGSQSLFPFIHNVLPALEGVEYNIAMGYPLERTPLYGFLQSLLTVVATMHEGRFLAAQYLQFLLHPYIKNIRFGNRTDVTRILVHTIEEYLAEHTTLSSFTMEEIEERPEVFRQCATLLKDVDNTCTVESLHEHLCSIHRNTVRRILDIQSGITLGAFADNLLSVLTYIYDSSTARLHPFFNEYIEQLIEALNGLRNSLASEHRFSTADEYLAFLHQYLTHYTVPFHGTPLRGLQVLGLLETRTIKFRTVYLLDANEGVLPPAYEPTLIPQQVRLQLGLETHEGREKLIEYLVRVLLQGAERIHIFFADSSSGRKEMSRYVQKLLWQLERSAGKVGENEIVQTVRYNVHLGSKEPAAIKKSDAALKLLKSFTFTATKLDTYLRCPLKFYYQYVLQLEEQDAVAEEVEAKDIGTLVHEILRRVFQPHVGTRLQADFFQPSNVDRVINETLQEYFGVTVRGRILFLKRQIQKHILNFFAHYQIPLLRSSTVELLGVEEKVNGIHKDVLFFARFDHIERRNSKVTLLDYKTSAQEKKYKINFRKLNPDDRSTWNSTIGSLQLPLYVLLYSTLHRLSATEISAAYLLLGKRKLDSSIEAPLYADEEECAQWQPQLENIIHALIAEIQSADVPFSPTDDIPTHCPYCPMKVVCGTQWAAM